MKELGEEWPGRQKQSQRDMSQTWGDRRVLAEGKPAAPGVRRGPLDTATELTCDLSKSGLSQRWR